MNCKYYSRAPLTGLMGLTVAALLAVLAPSSLARDVEADNAKLVVGTLDAPPFAMKTPEGTWGGFSFDLLNMITTEMKRDYEVREFTDIQTLINAVDTGVVNLIPVLAARAEAEAILDLTQPYYRSGFGIAVSQRDTGQGWSGFFRAVDLAQFFAVVGGLVLLWLLAGSSLWLLERRHNQAMFGGGPASGLGHGIWWAAVTMTTVGYGDKAPLTVGGRVVAIIWMFASIILVSSFTASISASLTAEKLVGKVRGVQDLPHVRVGSMTDSGALDWLRQRGITAATSSSVRIGLQAVVDGKIDAFVFDEAVLKSVTASDFPNLVYVLPQSFEHYYVSMGVQNNSSLREAINQATLRIMETDAWPRLLERHLSLGETVR